jgi:hypothetical protein
MSKAKTNALDALRGLIAERQQYEQWISALDAKREATPEHVFERVQNDYKGRLDRVLKDIHGYADELQQSISTLSSRLVEVAREEDTRREGLQEAELRAAVGEYEAKQWQQLKGETEQALAKIAADRAALDSQLGELRAIQKLSEMGSGSPPEGAMPAGAKATDQAELLRPADSQRTAVAAGAAPSTRPDDRAVTAAPSREPASPQSRAPSAPAAASAAQQASSLEPPGAAPPTAATAGAAKARTMRTPPGGVSAVRSKPDASRPDAAKTLKCPECGTANYPTEWYCERCGGELATM